MDNFEKALRGHDWYYHYSDDHSYWSRGSAQAQSLNIMHSELNCPYDMQKLQSWVFEMVKDKFLEEEPGKWYRIPRQKYAAHVEEKALLTRGEYQEITDWFKNNK